MFKKDYYNSCIELGLDSKHAKQVMNKTFEKEKPKNVDEAIKKLMLSAQQAAIDDILAFKENDINKLLTSTANILAQCAELTKLFYPETSIFDSKILANVEHSVKILLKKKYNPE